MEIHAQTTELEFAERVSRAAGFNMRQCYLCGKCSAGCPVAFKMKPTIFEIMEMVQMGREEELLRSPALWYCVSCETCSTRCPKECKPSRVVDVLREWAIARGLAPRSIMALMNFHRSFMSSVRRYGKVYEIGMIRDYKLRTLRFFEDMQLGLQMLQRGKIHLFPSRIKGIKTVEKLFRHYWEQEHNQ